MPADSRIFAVTVPGPHPSGAGDAQVNDTRRFQVSDLPAVEEQRWLIGEPGAALFGWPKREHGGDECVPARVISSDRHAVSLGIRARRRKWPGNSRS